MGYYSSPAITFLMALFNVRLGWWLGNTGTAGRHTYAEPGPVVASGPLLAETFGRTDDESPYVYLSDGGHFENLGLYEMVRRRCRLIIVVDAGADPSFNFTDLGNAIRKIRIDLGIPIDFGDDVPIYRRDSAELKSATHGQYFDVAKIRYSVKDQCSKDGALIYIKPTFYGREPADVRQYARACAAFPHETTADQFYTESQFESYRALGKFILGDVLEDLNSRLPSESTAVAIGEYTLDSLYKAACQYLECQSKEQHHKTPATDGQNGSGEDDSIVSVFSFLATRKRQP
jgi:hypothetical protein